MPLDDFTESWKEFFQQRPISCSLQVVINSVEHPQCGIGSVVLRSFPAVRKTVRDQALVGEGSKRPEETACFAISACTQQQARQGNHTIASPVGEPGIACNDRFPVGRELERFVLSRRIRRWRWPGDDELIGGDNQASLYGVALWQVVC